MQAAGGFAAPLARAVTILMDIGPKRHLGSPSHSPAWEIDLRVSGLRWEAEDVRGLLVAGFRVPLLPCTK